MAELRPPAPGWRAAVAQGAAAVPLAAALAATVAAGLAPAGRIDAALLGGAIMASAGLVVIAGMARAYPHARLGLCNLITLLRAALVAGLATLLAGPDGVGADTRIAWAALGVAAAALALDGLDGWAARRAGLCSGFGARFDMEVDVALALILSLLLWHSGKLGVWVLLLGAPRHLFLLLTLALPALRAPLPPALWRKAGCVAQIGALLVALAPPVGPGAAAGVALAGLLAVGSAFARDVLWLLRRGGRDAAEPPTALTAALAAAAVTLALAAPTHPDALQWSVLLRPPLEAAPILLALTSLRAPAFRLLCAVALWAALVVKLADLGMNAALARPVDWVSDVALLPSAWTLASDAVGGGVATLAVVGAALALASALAALWWATGVWSRPVLRRGPAALAALALGALAAVDALTPRGLGLPAQALTGRVVGERVAETRATLRDLEGFRALTTRDRVAAGPPNLGGLTGRDLILVFIESYGRSSLVNPVYRPTHASALRDAEARLAEHGLAMRSAWITAPTAGGQSWLSHATLVSGLWIDSQSRYGALLASPRRTLHHASQAAGRRTVAIKPAHTVPWPEGAYFGFDAVHDAARLGYRGPSFNWVTMPDQFTLAAFDRLERDDASRPPLTAQIALVSSHAPWTPVAPVLPWHGVGDGTVYAPFAAAGDPPEVVWRDPDRVREQFRRSIAYSLTVVGQYLARHAGDGSLTVVLGDHEPAAFVAGVESREVPIHLIGPPALLARIEAWGFTPGLVPGEDAPVWRMDAFRDRFLAAFSDQPA